MAASPEALAGHRCAAMRAAGGTPTPWLFKRAGRRPFEFQPQLALTTNDPETLVDLALAGAGIVQAGLHHALPQLRAGTLKLLLPGVHDAGRREIVVHYPHRQFLAPRVRVVVDALLAHFAAAEALHLSVDALLAELPGLVAKPAAVKRAGPRRSSHAGAG